MAEYSNYLSRLSLEPFEWGRCDCWQLVGGVSGLLTGYNPAEKYIGRYKTEIGAARLLKKVYGGFTVEDALVAEFVEIDIGKAQCGDFAVVADPTGTRACGIIQKSNVLAYQGGWLTGLPKNYERVFTCHSY